jgi:transcriptional regulator with XRE-family HTH domain
MSIGERVKEERERLGKSQTEFGEAAGVNRGSQFNYEQGRRIPDAEYLAAIAKLGADVLYILVGEEQFQRVQALSPEEQYFVDCLRVASPDMRRAALAVLLHGSRDSMAPEARARANLVFHGGVGQVVQGDVSGGVKIDQGAKRKSKSKPDTP